MTDLPRAWEWANLGELVDVLDSRRIPVSARERANRPGSVPYYGAAGQVGFIDKAMFDEDLVLLGEDGVQFFDPGKSKAYAIRGPSWVNNHAHVLRARPGFEQRYLLHYLNHFDYRGHVSGTTRLKLTQSAMNTIPVSVPPIAEQRRIVEELDSLLGRLELGVRSVREARARIRTAKKSIIADALPNQVPSSWKMVSVAEAGRVDLGRQRHPDWHHGENMKPYLRVANVFEDRIDLTDVMEMHFSPAEFERFRLVPGDILLNEGQSPEYLGRPAMYVGEPSAVAFTNSLLRFKANSDVLPEWALLVFRRHMHSGRFQREVRITTNIAHLSASRFKSVEFPIPPLEEQWFLVDQVRERLADVERASNAIDIAEARSTALRRSLLADTFAGRLVPQDPAEEPASVLLDRVRGERAVQPKPMRANGKARGAK